jgi:hypothetical protein
MSETVQSTRLDVNCTLIEIQIDLGGLAAISAGTGI